MTEKTLEQYVLNAVSYDLDEVFILDIFNDEYTSFSLLDGAFTVKEKKSLAKFLDEVKETLEEQYLKEYMNSISIPKLQDERKNGNERITITYKTLDNKT